MILFKRLKALFLKNFFILIIALIAFNEFFGQSPDSLSIALKVIDLSFPQTDLDSMQDGILEQKNSFKSLRNSSIPNDLPNSLVFTPPINMNVLSEKQDDIQWKLEKKIIHK